MELFERNIFSRQLFQPFTNFTKSSILDLQLRSEYASETINYFRKRLHLDVWLGSRYTCNMLKKDKNSEKLVKELHLEMLQLRLWNNFYKISEKNSTEKWFSSQLFSASFVRSPEAAIRGVLLKKLFLKISQYSQEKTCVRVKVARLQSGLQLY